MNNHDEFHFALKVAQVLDQGTQGLGRETRDKLLAARRKALGKQKVALAGLSLAGLGQFTSEVLLPQARMLAAMFALVLGVLGTYYWNSFQQAAEMEEIDSALLTDELPINAYLDRGFRAWLERPSQAPQE